MSKRSLSKRGKIRLCFVLFIAVLLLGLFLIHNGKWIFFRPLQASEVKSVSINIRDLSVYEAFPNDITVEISDPASIQKIAETEAIARKWHRDHFFLKLVPWQIEYTWQLTDGSEKKRVYRGQKAAAELKTAFAAVPEIRSRMDEEDG